MDLNTSLAGRLHSRTSRTQTVQWHPKLTPYRFLVLLTTIGLGSAKAYAVSQNLVLVATSIEWVTGVVIFLILFILGLYETETNPPRYLKWLLTSDLVHLFFRMASLSPPNYRSDEQPAHTINSQGLKVTGYRLLASMSVGLFGIAKAYFTYRNIYSAANVLDWSLGIIVTSCLYFLGLYENNPVHLMPYLFSTDYSAGTYYILWLIIYMIGITICAWLWTFISNLMPALASLYNFGESGGYLMLLALFLLPPFSIIILSVCVLELCWNHSPAPLVRMRRVVQKVFVKLEYLLYTHLPLSLSPWMDTCRLTLVMIFNRIRNNGIGMLACVFGSVCYAGIALVSLAALIGLRPLQLEEGFLAFVVLTLSYILVFVSCMIASASFAFYFVFLWWS